MCVHCEDGEGGVCLQSVSSAELSQQPLGGAVRLSISPNGVLSRSFSISFQLREKCFLSPGLLPFLLIIYHTSPSFFPSFLLLWPTSSLLLSFPSSPRPFLIPYHLSFPASFFSSSWPRTHFFLTPSSLLLLLLLLLLLSLLSVQIKNQTSSRWMDALNIWVA